MTAAEAPVDRDLRGALEELAAERLGGALVAVDRRPSAYRTSSPLEILDLTLEGGGRVSVLFKHLSRDALTEEARRAKPEFLFHPLREIETYRLILEPAGMGTARFYGAVPERGWLFVEKVRGVELYQVGERETWAEAARWSARMHARLGGQSDELVERAHLLRLDRGFFLEWLDRARAFSAADASRLLERLGGRYEQVAEELAALPRTFLHGELYASNVIVDRTSDGLRVCPVDWELAAVGPGLVDLAALTAGRWGDEDRGAIAEAYLEEADGLEEAAFWRGLDLCRLHLAVQWLGWAEDWAPPEEHVHDWVSEGLAAADRLDL